MSNVVKRVTDLLDRAGHEKTPEKEALTCLRLAVSIMKKHRLAIVERVEVKQARVYEDDLTEQWWQQPMPNPVEMVDLVTYKPVQTHVRGVCKACGRRFHMNEMVAQTLHNGATHWSCKGYWHSGGK